jgi:hypothetical protein
VDTSRPHDAKHHVRLGESQRFGKAVPAGGIQTAKLCDVDPRAWLADMLARIADHTASRIEELLPWRWKAAREQNAQAA